ncbi:hypothetical protein QCA50_005258 [Cerrena zonata]|uniref:Uncharacterized protein n=1 Tax=Cerrena zonata TaxID=2478898 RepID=A0AAW0GQL8_9APHY
MCCETSLGMQPRRQGRAKGTEPSDAQGIGSRAGLGRSLIESLVKFIYRDYGLSQCVDGRRAWCPTLRETSCSPLAGSASIAFRPFNVHRYDPGTLITHRTWYGIHRSKLLSISCLPHYCFSDANDLHSNMYRSRARRPHLVHPGPSVDMITRASRLHFGVEVLHFTCSGPGIQSSAAGSTSCRSIAPSFNRCCKHRIQLYIITHFNASHSHLSCCSMHTLRQRVGIRQLFLLDDLRLASFSQKRGVSAYGDDAMVSDRIHQRPADVMDLTSTLVSKTIAALAPFRFLTLQECLSSSFRGSVHLFSDGFMLIAMMSIVFDIHWMYILVLKNSGPFRFSNPRASLLKFWCIRPFQHDKRLTMAQRPLCTRSRHGAGHILAAVVGAFILGLLSVASWFDSDIEASMWILTYDVVLFISKLLFRITRGCRTEHFKRLTNFRMARVRSRVITIQGVLHPTSLIAAFPSVLGQ